ncbi:MAG: ATP-binding cassette domain-containing protein [Pedobacter sp.]|nr:MAG: ATP-binding cassette domain-containing protein [Pedobacter sp.]
MIQIDIAHQLKRYRGIENLRIQANFQKGSTVQISGPSGVGKTTLLRIIAGLLKPDKGLIISNGETWLETDRGINTTVQSRNLGFVFQDYALFPNLSVKEHMSFGTKDQNWINRLLEMGRMEGFRDQKPRQLSGGQQQRLAILRALSTKPSLMLMDEPFSALDQSLKLTFLPELKQLFKETEITALIVTHHPFELNAIKDDSLEL